MNVVQKNLTLLTNALSVSGYEWQLDIVNVIQKIVGYKGRRIGDSIVYKFGNGKKKIFVSAHMDEIGFFITQVKNNYVKIMPIGNVSIRDAIGSKLIFKTGRSFLTSDTLNPADSFSSLKVYGLNQTSIGDVGTFDKKVLFENQVIKATGLDNKVGCAVLLELIKSLNLVSKDRSIYLCFSCQEEVGTNGIIEAVKKINPSVCVDIDSAYAKCSKFSEKNMNNWAIPELGKGPAIQLIGEGFIIKSGDRKLVELICRKNNISYQYEIPDGISGGTNAGSLINAGYRTIQINIPVSNQHTSLSTASLIDISLTSKLVRELINIL